MNRFRWSPQQLETVRLAMASGKTAQEIADNMGFTRASIRTAAKRHKLGEWVYRRPGYGHNIPDDFEQRLAEIRTCRGMARHYDISDSTVSRYMQMRGLIYPPPFRREAKPKKPKISRVTSADMGRMKAPNIIGEPIRDMSAAGRAADYLRRYGPVFRRGNDWYRGSTRLTDAQLIQRAQGLGWVL